MKRFPKCGLAFQGDIAILRIDELPSGLREVPPDGCRLIVGHSETGHHHFVDRTVGRLLQGQDPNVCYLVAEGAYALLQHDRDVNPHETIELPGNGQCYEIHRQQEWTPEGWRQVCD